MKETGSSRAIMGNVKDNAGNIGNGIIGGLVDSTRGLACWENHSKGPCVSGSLMSDNGHAFLSLSSLSFILLYGRTTLSNWLLVFLKKN
jgi:hypothetical protein